MASLTIRKLDEDVKVYLRLRSARNGRSVEEEVRVILREMVQGVPFDSPRRRPQPVSPPPTHPPAFTDSRPTRTRPASP